ncbi:MAG: hypothetical protein NXH75_13270 [Halobacteriovoraceae bacterium]|nr:hypothetical protein [Halobacteriovoraceae bacterium]
MKLAFLLILFSLVANRSLKANEDMKVYHCPRIFKLALKDLKLSPPEDHSEAKKLVHKLAQSGRIAVRMRVGFTGAGKCHYEGRNLDGSFFWGTLSVDEENQTAASYLLKIRSNTMQLLIPVPSFSSKGLALDEEEVDLFYKSIERGSQRVSIGSATLNP